jgi:aryl-alcohol dehydrogenase-like predicted oxidoreductase
MTSVLVGASNVAQITENAAALNQLQFGADELQAIDAIVGTNPQPPRKSG